MRIIKLIAAIKRRSIGSERKLRMKKSTWVLSILFCSYYFSNGQRTEGNYINGVLKGEGKFIFGDGSWFEGQFEDGTKRAKGNYYNKDGTKRAADMIDGVVKPIG